MANAQGYDEEEAMLRVMSTLCLDEPAAHKANADKIKVSLDDSKTLSLDEPRGSLLLWGTVKNNKSFDDIARREPDSTFHNTDAPRVKCRKLQERRGSSQSLTIAVKPAENTLPTVMTPRECSAAQFLLTAGNCMSRFQLRNCLRDVRTLHAEFWSIPTNIPDQVDRVSGSAHKNRYRCVLPNPHSRVRLPSDLAVAGGDYINANYVRSYNGLPRAYIATQGPLSHTVDDFWLMCFTEKSPSVVMITKLVEGGKPKCEPYVPESQTTYGNVTVQVLCCTEDEGYTVREIVLKKGDETHRLTHFWFAEWPDHKTPNNPRALLHMANAVESIRQEYNKSKTDSSQECGPVIVHCSAGLGRTGCFLAICHGINQLRNEGKVDILSIVCSLRCDRGGMVQTAEQYEFIHRGLCLFERTLSDYNIH